MSRNFRAFKNLLMRGRRDSNSQLSPTKSAGPMGFEPTIFGSTNRRVKPSYTTDPFWWGGCSNQLNYVPYAEGGVRTHDFRLMSAML